MRKRKYLLALIFLWAAIYLASSPRPPALLDDADTVHAEAAREMAETGDWITLRANKIRYLEKAPLMYWLIALSYKVFGVSEFSSRLPIALGTLGLILAIFLFGKFAFGEKAAFYAALAIATCIGIYLFTRVLWPDCLLTLFITMAFYCYLRAREYQTGASNYAYGIYAFSALAVLTKGLIGAVFPAVIILAHLIVTREIRHLARFKLFTGTLVFLLIAAPWHIAAGLSNKGFFWFYFVNEHFLRYVGKRYPIDYDTVPLWLFLALHIIWLFPWSFFLPLTIKIIPRRLRALNRQENAALFMLIWAAIIIIFFSFSTTQEYYTMPAYAAFALLIGSAIARAEEESKNERSRLLNVAQSALAVLGLLVFAAGMTAFVMTRRESVADDISTTLTRNPEAYALSLGHVLDLTPQTLAALRVPVVGTALAFFLGTAAAWALRLKRFHPASNASLALMMAAFFFFAHLSLVAFEPYLSSRSLADAIDREYKDGEVIIINGEYEGGSSINFYTRKMVYILNGRSANLEYGSHFEDAPQIFLDDDDVARMWAGPNRIYLFTDSYHLDKVTRVLPDPIHRLAESGGKVILTNRR